MKRYNYFSNFADIYGGTMTDIKVGHGMMGMRVAYHGLWGRV